MQVRHLPNSSPQYHRHWHLAIITQSLCGDDVGDGNWILVLTFDNKEHRTASNASIGSQLAVLKTQMCGVIASIIRLCSGVMWRWRCG